MQLEAAIDRFLKRTKMPQSRFGREAIGDPGFLGDLKKGRQPRPKMIARVLSFIADHGGEI